VLLLKLFASLFIRHGQEIKEERVSEKKWLISNQSNIASSPRCVDGTLFQLPKNEKKTGNGVDLLHRLQFNNERSAYISRPQL